MKVERPIVSLEESHTHEGGEVNFELPPKFDDYEEHELETPEEEETNDKEEEEHEEVMFYVDKGDMLELKPPLNIQKCTFQPQCETQTTSPPSEQAKNVSFTPKMVELRPHVNNGHLLNLRTNSFQQGEDDGDPPSGHSKTLNKAKDGLKEAPKNPKDGHK